MNDILYAWEPSAAATFYLDGCCVASLPIDFLESANVKNWTYVRYVLRAVVCLPDSFDIMEYDHSVSSEIPQALDYEIVCETSPFGVTFQQGPQGKSPCRAKRDTDELSTVSASSEASSESAEARFREALLARDGHCVVTGSTTLDGITACPIVPQSLGQEYLNTITKSLRIAVNSPRNGLLLNDTFHKRFDRYLWGIYHFEGEFYLHSFEKNPDDPFSSRFYHGRRLLFNKDFKDMWPNVALVDWHYRQCLMARVRGFVAGALF